MTYYKASPGPHSSLGNFSQLVSATNLPGLFCTYLKTQNDFGEMFCGIFTLLYKKIHKTFCTLPLPPPPVCLPFSPLLHPALIFSLSSSFSPVSSLFSTGTLCHILLQREQFIWYPLHCLVQDPMYASIEGYSRVLLRQF